MSSNRILGLREAGIRAGVIAVRHAPKIIEAIEEVIPAEDVEQVDGLLRVMAAFDRDIAEHMEAVGTMGALLAYHASLSAATMGACLLGGRLHDIGKMAISRTLLQKTGAPTRSDWAELKLVPMYGSGTLNGLPRLKYLSPIVAAVHERPDGRGYPHRLAGDEIPLESQIIAIADAFCAMTAPRPYASTLMPHEAIAQLRREAGRQFNEDLVDSFADMFAARPLQSLSDTNP